MKYFIFLFLLISNIALSCGVVGAKVMQAHRYHDGYIFVDFDKPTDCDCTISNRLAFRDDDPNMDFVKSMILVAYTTGALITARSDLESCSIHGNTAKMTYFMLQEK
ncbi:hypothetical protein [Teredinibacter waterburyi]|uniref:hypothetical protein n=1 Tax=Teredinibacter waterburyi TaxID=1500538 RepID=UPI00165F731A|nr:hypothetical protein [Teredinibacter waterburyi]